jgi:lysozyme
MKTPQLNEPAIRAILEANGVDQSKVAVVAIRGYYLDSMGKRGRNDRRIYDDAMFVVHPDGVERFQANTDPNGYRKGRGTGSRKGMAMLRPGIHRYGKGLHKGRQAFRQCERFTVIRDGAPPYEDLGYHAINLHSGGYTSTSSLGCQTIPKSTWQRFKRSVYDLLDEYKNPIRQNDWGQRVRSFDYVLIEETERRKGKLKVSQRYLQPA